MAFANNKYTISFRDVQNRQHVVYLDPDLSPAEDYSGGVTVLKPAGMPVNYEFGQDGDDEFRIINPTGLTIKIVVANTTVFEDVSGGAALSWRVRWDIGGTEVWRGYLMTDELEQPFNLPSTLTLRAVCGLKELDGTTWAASAGIDSFIDHIDDLLDGLPGHENVPSGVGAVDIAYFANWHSHTGSTQSGNSFSVYDFDSAAFSDPLDATNKPVSSVVLAQVVGRFGAKICQANGKWRIYQRGVLGGSTYTMDNYTSGTEAIGQFSLADARVFSDAVQSNATAFHKVSIGYYHYPEDTGFLLNGIFRNWSDPPSVPASWAEVGAGSKLTEVSIYGNPYARLVGFSTDTALRIADIAHTGSDYGVDAVVNADDGITQESAFDVRSTSHKIILSFNSRHIGNEGASLFFFYSIWIDGGQGTDYYWNAPTKAWVAGGGGGGTILSPGDNSKMSRLASASWNEYSIETANAPDVGPIRLYLWTVVDKGGNTAGILYRDVRLGYNTGDKSERVKVTVTATNTNLTSGLQRDESFFFIGQGPSKNHSGAIEHGDHLLAENWKDGSYSGDEVSSGNSLEKLHATQILKARESPTPRIRLTFRPSSGSYWPHQSLLYSSKNYSCVSLSYNARLDEYRGEWIEVSAGSTTPTYEEDYSDDDVRPTDFGKPVDLGHPGGGGRSTGFGFGGRNNNLFQGPHGWQQRAATTATDSSGILANNRVTGALEVGGNCGLDSAVTGGDDIRIWAGDTLANKASAEFKVTEAGVLTATNATITGEITATSGSLTNLTISGTLTMGASGVLDFSSEGRINFDGLGEITGGSNPVFRGSTATLRATNIAYVTGQGVSLGSGLILIDENAQSVMLSDTASHQLGFHGITPVARQTITGGRDGSPALADLLTKLAAKGLIIDGTGPGTDVQAYDALLQTLSALANASGHLKNNGSGTLSWEAGGVGDVVGPGSAVDNALVRFNSTTGKIVQTSGVILDDSNNLTGINDATITGHLTAAVSDATFHQIAKLKLNEAYMHWNRDGGSIPSISGTTEFILSNSSAAGDSVYMSLISGNTGSSRINFGDTDSEAGGGFIQFNHSTQTYTLEVAGATRYTQTSALTTFAQAVTLGSGDLTLSAGELLLSAATSARSSMNIPSGVAPSSPANGDIWSDGSDLLVRLGGTTYTLHKISP